MTIMCFSEFSISRLWSLSSYVFYVRVVQLKRDKLNWKERITAAPKLPVVLLILGKATNGECEEFEMGDIITDRVV